MTLCRQGEPGMLSTSRKMVTCPHCLSLSEPQECSICRRAHGREVTHACE